MKTERIERMNKLGAAAIAHWGVKAQMVKACEEMAELTVKLCKKLNASPVSDADIIDEIADVTIMANQMRMYFDERAVDEHIDYKLDRLERALQAQYSRTPT